MQGALSQKISLLLKQRNLTINEFEKSSGLGKSAVSNIIHGRSKNPSIEVINAIAKNLGCTIEYLILEPSSRDQATPSSNETNYRLCVEASNRLAEHLMSSETNVTHSDFFKCAQEIYQFARESGQEFIDERFVKWSVKKFLEKDENLKFKHFIIFPIICISSITIFCLKEYYFFRKEIHSQDETTLETLKTLKKLIVFIANNIQDNVHQDEIQQWLSIHFGYNLIFDNDLLLNNSRMSTIRNGVLLNALGVEPKNSNQLHFAENLSKKYREKAILYHDFSSEKDSICILYTTQHSLNTFILAFPLAKISSIKVQLLEKNDSKAIHLPLLVETNKFISEEFVSENAIFHADLDFTRSIVSKYYEIITLALIQIAIFLTGLALLAIANLKKKRILTKFNQILETDSEKSLINKLLEHTKIISTLEATIKQLENKNITLTKIAEVNKKSVMQERNINKTLAKNLDENLKKITQLTSDAIKNFNSGISMSSQMTETLLNTIKDAAARLLFLKNGASLAILHKPINIKDSLKKSLTIFGPELYELECRIDMTDFDDDLKYPCSEIVLVQMFNGILNRLLFSMEKANGNFIQAIAKNNDDGLKLIFENSSWGSIQLQQILQSYYPVLSLYQTGSLPRPLQKVSIY